MQQNDGGFGRAQEAFLQLTDLASLACGLDGRIHHGERLFLALLSFAQRSHGLLVARIDQELETANTFERQNFSGANHLRGFEQGLS